MMIVILVFNGIYNINDEYWHYNFYNLYNIDKIISYYTINNILIIANTNNEKCILFYLLSNN
jgi:hypothetical protein